ncbi:Protein accelerated cell death [Parasponia andersonii]|uniref:Protein accelerated cell death n=1 Tax=Parasponia andersonii TaxID=3476 RepID=A0A2P5A7B9_PARAD|nr:Protein accelerated cell death [Parasponia andersonii]
MNSEQCLNLLYDDIRIMNRQNETDTGTQPGSVPDDNLTVRHFTYPEIYRAVVTGNVALFRRNSEDIELSRLTQLVSPRGETVLHIAAQSGHDELVRAILGRHDLLGLVVAQNNWLRNTPLHATASAGHLSTVKMLVSAAKEYSQQQRGSLKMVLGIKNKQNDTALHLALRNRHLEVARFLFEADDDPEGVDYFNSEYKSPLYMAAEAGYELLFELMMQKHAAYVDGTAEVVQEYRWSVAIAAVLVKNRGKSSAISHTYMVAAGLSGQEFV